MFIVNNCTVISLENHTNFNNQLETFLKLHFKSEKSFSQICNELSLRRLPFEILFQKYSVRVLLL